MKKKTLKVRLYDKTIDVYAGAEEHPPGFQLIESGTLLVRRGQEALAMYPHGCWQAVWIEEEE